LANLSRGYLLAIRTAAQKLKKVLFHLETGLLTESALQFAEVTISKVNDSATAGADQVVMVFDGSSHEIAPAVAYCVYLTDEP
jgi:hypothetical protein